VLKTHTHTKNKQKTKNTKQTNKHKTQNKTKIHTFLLEFLIEKIEICDWCDIDCALPFYNPSQALFQANPSPIPSKSKPYRMISLTAQDDLRRDQLLRIAEADTIIKNHAMSHDASPLDKTIWQKRMGRRMVESFTNTIIPPGPWDDDLDEYHQHMAGTGFHSFYHFDIGNGWKGHLQRGSRGWAWGGFIHVPENCVLEIDDFDLDGAPQVITYQDGSGFAFDHDRHSWDVQPALYEFNKLHAANPADLPPPKAYLSFSQVRDELFEVAKYLMRFPLFNITTYELVSGDYPQ
jgi:hypothetical protein